MERKGLEGGSWRGAGGMNWSRQRHGVTGMGWGGSWRRGGGAEGGGGGGGAVEVVHYEAMIVA